MKKEEIPDERIGDATLYVGDCRTILASLPEQSVQTCITSPPYFGLRSYDEEALRIDPSLDAETRQWLEAELVRRGVNAR